MANLVNLCSITSVAAATGVTEVKRFQTRVKRKKKQNLYADYKKCILHIKDRLKVKVK